MDSRAIQQVAVWLDDALSADATLPHAIEWALGLNLPVRVVAMSSAMPERIRTWEAACAQKGVPVEMHLPKERTKDNLAGSLCVFAGPAGSSFERELLQTSLCHPESCQLLCSGSNASIRRVLILCHQPTIHESYLESAAQICQALETTPLVLVLARSEREARIGQEQTEKICGKLGLEADLDTIVHSDLAEVVVRVVAWRNCSHVIMERQVDVSWWDRVHSAFVRQCGGASFPASVLAIPEGVFFDVPHKVKCSRAILPWTQPPANPVDTKLENRV
jgi:hypothetical protein